MLNEIHVSNFRSFKGTHKIPLAPLTILVGENSSGKSTLLALARLSWDLGALRPGTNLDFNEPPFSFGSYDDIAHYHGGQGKRATSFQLGGVAAIPNRPHSYSSSRAGPLPSEATWSATFTRSSGQPLLTSFRLSTQELEAEISASSEKPGPLVKLRYRSRQIPIHSENLFPEESVNLLALRSSLQQHLLQRRGTQQERNADLGPRRCLETIQGLAAALRASRPYAMSPIRTKPQRTYDALQRQPQPDGAHVPQMLASLALRDNAEWEPVQSSIQAYAKNAGLFDELHVRSLGSRRETDPFQIQVVLDGFQGRPNLVDVGYGVSQVLPVLFDAVASPNRDFLLIQQPEVHLHPRAQAELGSFLLNQTKPSRRIVVETHSDHLIDRIRMDIRDRRITSRSRSKHVAILFIERTAGRSVVHDIRVSSEGDLVAPPAGYRRFFLEEERRFMGL